MNFQYWIFEKCFKKPHWSMFDTEFKGFSSERFSYFMFAFHQILDWMLLMWCKLFAKMFTVYSIVKFLSFHWIILIWRTRGSWIGHNWRVEWIWWNGTMTVSIRINFNTWSSKPGLQQVQCTPGREPQIARNKKSQIQMHTSTAVYQMK